MDHRYQVLDLYFNELLVQSKYNKRNETWDGFNICLDFMIITLILFVT